MSDTMRDAFEAWDCQEFCIDVEHYRQVNGVYLDAPIRNRWLTWQAAQSQPAPPVPQTVQGTGLTLPKRIAELIEQHGSLRAVARVIDCDPGYLSRLQSGEKDDPGNHLLRRMGLRQIVTYERIKP